MKRESTSVSLPSGQTVDVIQLQNTISELKSVLEKRSVEFEQVSLIFYAYYRFICVIVEKRKRKVTCQAGTTKAVDK